MLRVLESLAVSAGEHAEDRAEKTPPGRSTVRPGLRSSQHTRLHSLCSAVLFVAHISCNYCGAGAENCPGPGRRMRRQYLPPPAPVMS